MSDPATQEWRDAMTMSTGARLRAAMDANQQLSAALAASQADLTRAEDELDEAREELDELRALRDAIPCVWCDGVGVAPAERFGRDADGAPIRDEDGPCPEGCTVAPWLQAERNDAADELAETKHHWALDVDALITARQEIEQQAIRLDNALDENAALRTQIGRDSEAADRLIRDRDEAQEAADKLAAAIAEFFGLDIGEHSNLNDPWLTALVGVQRAMRSRLRDLGDGYVQADRDDLEEMLRRGGER